MTDGKLSIECLSRGPTRCRTSKPYSVVIPNTETDTKGATRRCGFPECSYGPSLAVHGCYTSYETFRRGVQINPHGPCLGHRAIDSIGRPTPYIFQTYREVEERIDHVAAGLEHEKLTLPNSDSMKLLGLYSRNRPEWVIAEQAAFCHRCVTVPLYDTLGPDSLEFILTETGVPTVFCGGEAELAKLIRLKKDGKCSTLSAAVTMDPLRDSLQVEAVETGLRVYQMFQLEAIGASHLKSHPHNPPSNIDVATFCYTSGTTGNSKGALLTHLNLVSGSAAVDALGVVKVKTDSVYFSYLPLPHIYEREVQLGMFAGGASVGFWRNDPFELIPDVIALRPMMMPAVPRVLNRIYDKITQSVLDGGGLKARLFVRACEAKVYGLHKGELSHAIWDRLIFNKIKRSLGMDRLTTLVTGSAPIASHVLTFWRILLGCDVIEGYGQTETAAASTITQIGDFSAGHVGGPIPSCEICLMDVPEMNYFHTDSWHGGDPREGGGGGIPCFGRGEVCFRGTNIFKGYYRNPEKTAEAFDSDGWLHSGDIGLWTSDGALKIIDRKKNIFKLSQGEYVAPEKIENILQLTPLIAQSLVYGDSLKSYLVAVIVPDFEVVRNWCEKNEVGASVGAEDLCSMEALVETIQRQIDEAGVRAGLQRFEMVRSIHLSHEPFTVENGLMTPTMKLRRQEAVLKFRDALERLYGFGAISRL